MQGVQGLGDQTGQNAPQAGPEMPEAGDMPETEATPVPPEAESAKPKNYMFFSNLKVIKEKVDQILSMDAAQIDTLLSDGHDWASDHVSTSKDELEEVCNWLVGEMK